VVKDYFATHVHALSRLAVLCLPPCDNPGVAGEKLSPFVPLCIWELERADNPETLILCRATRCNTFPMFLFFFKICPVQHRCAERACFKSTCLNVMRCYLVFVKA
jgi:hypothetical protein